MSPPSNVLCHSRKYILICTHQKPGLFRAEQTLHSLISVTTPESAKEYTRNAKAHVWPHTSHDLPADAWSSTVLSDLHYHRLKEWTLRPRIVQLCLQTLWIPHSIGHRIRSCTVLPDLFLIACHEKSRRAKNHPHTHAHTRYTCVLTPVSHAFIHTVFSPFFCCSYWRAM